MSKPIDRKCPVQCPAGDNTCFEDCSRDYNENLKKCPCQEHCPGGCPCPDYQCPSWILVLSTYSSSNVPLIMDGNGQHKEIGFSYGADTEVYHSCSITWHGTMYIFGGSSEKRQISVVDQCKLTKIGELPFDMNLGACSQRDNGQMFICFEN